MTKRPDVLQPELVSRRGLGKPGMWRDGLLAVTLVATVGLVHLVIPGLIPTGADPGNWLAVGKELRGLAVMSAAVTYPALFPMIVAALLTFLPSIAAVVVAALLAVSVLVVALYVCCRPLGRTLAALAVVSTALAGAQLEIYAWGGYPQIMGSGFLLLAIFLLVQFLDTGRPLQLVLGVGLAVLVAVTHVLIAGVLVIALPVAFVYWLLSAHISIRTWYRTWWVMALGIGPSVTTVVFSLDLGAVKATEPVLNPYDKSLLTSVADTARDAPLLWLLLLIVAIAVVLRGRWPESQTPIVGTGVSLLVSSLAVFLLTGEQRGLLPVQMGVVLLSVVGIHALYEWVRNLEKAKHTTVKFPRLRSKTIIVIGLSIVSGLVVGGLGTYADASDWYRVVDQSELAGLDQLRLTAQPGDLTIASKGHNGIQTGWWVEGYGEQPTYAALDLRLVAFPEERTQAEIANRIFSGNPTDDQIRAELTAIGADFLVVDRRGPDASWLDGGLARSLPVLYDSPTLVILRFEPPA